MATNMEVMTMIAYQQQELRATGPEALAQWRELAERAGYPTVNRAAGGFNVRSDACHDGGKDVTGVWVTLNAQGYPRAYCDNHQWPDSDTNFRERVGLPAFEERGSQPRRQGRIDPYQERDGWRVVGAYIRASTGRPRNVYRRDTPEGKQIKQDMHGRMDGYLPLVWRPESPAAEIPAVWVDGEKTAASVRDAGAVAISTIGGHKSAVKAAWAEAGEGERLLVWPDNTPQEVAAAEELVLHLAQLGYVVGVLAPVGEPGTGADAADLPGVAAILEHLQDEPVKWVHPEDVELPNPETGEVLEGATYRTDARGFQAAIATLGYEIRYNVRAGLRIEWRRRDWATVIAREWAAQMRVQPDGQGWWADADYAAEWIQDSIAHRLRTQGGNPLRFSADRWRHCVLATIAPLGADPVEDWLNGLPDWDGAERLDTLFVDALGAADTPLNRNAARGFLIGAVARILDPGCLHDWIPVLIGRQGCGKSSFCQYILPAEYRLDWFSDSVNLDDPEQKQVEQTGNAVIVEYSEMRGAMTARRDSLKSHITKRKAQYRPPYFRHSVEVRRGFIGIGTANDTGTGVLPYDPSGHRRYVAINANCDCAAPMREPCTCDRPRQMREYLDENRLQLWAEAVAKYRNAQDQTSIHLIDRNLIQAQSQTNRSHVVINDALADLIAHLRVEDGGQPIAELMFRCGYISNRDDGLDRRRQNEFAQGLVAAGWYKIRAKVSGVEAVRWYAPEPELLPVCEMPDCSSETLPGGRFCADCEGLLSEGPSGVQSLTDRGIKIYVICPTCEREQALPHICVLDATPIPEGMKACSCGQMFMGDDWPAQMATHICGG